MAASERPIPDGGDRRRRTDPADWSPREAVERYLTRRRPDATASSLKAWRYRLKLFVEWLEGIGVEAIGELEPLDFDEYYDIRGREIAPSTLEGQMWTLKMFVRYLEQVGAAEELEGAVRIPDLDPDERSRDTALRTEAATELLDFYRVARRFRGTRQHVLLELAWYSGARLSGLRALDLRDLNADAGCLEFRHRPETGTGLKNNIDGERPVGLPEMVLEVVDEYLAEERFDVRDEHGRQPLLASMKGRPAKGTIRSWSYRTTQPCHHGPCPHGKERERCEWTSFSKGSKCPSSRAPHHLRTGSITWQLNQGLPPAVVAERVNADTKTIKQHYDVATSRQRWNRAYDHLEARRPEVAKLDLDP